MPCANICCFTGHRPDKLPWGTNEYDPRCLRVKADIAVAKQYLGISRSEGISRGVIRGGMSSVADLFVAQMQDYLEDTGRINTPGIPSGNWQWRLSEGKLTDELAADIAAMTTLYGRA